MKIEDRPIQIRSDKVWIRNERPEHRESGYRFADLVVAFTAGIVVAMLRVLS